MQGGGVSGIQVHYEQVVRERVPDSGCDVQVYYEQAIREQYPGQGGYCEFVQVYWYTTSKQSGARR